MDGYAVVASDGAGEFDIVGGKLTSFHASGLFLLMHAAKAWRGDEWSICLIQVLALAMARSRRYPLAR